MENDYESQFDEYEERRNIGENKQNYESKMHMYFD